ncbi:MAG: hypothetical protein FJY75_07460, partial [Candidatus Eisenbacteria bacterium]|nr:hypothetical protein [Candidatus Eisenbacteria bacterium]
VWDDLTTLVEIDPAAGPPRASAGHGDGRGALLLLPAALTARLPGSVSRQIDALGTSERWRPGATVEGAPLDLASERRELEPALGPGSGAAFVAWSPGPAAESPSRVWFGRDRAGGMIAAGLEARSPEALEGALSARLPRLRPGGVEARAEAWARYTGARSADPRAARDRVLPHNGARAIDLAGALELGPAAPGAIAATAVEAQGPGAAGGAAWGLSSHFEARGERHDHFLEIYRFNSEHAPTEDLAALRSSTTATLRLGPRTRAAATLELSSWQNSLGDGLLRGDVREYYQPAGNAGADESGLYWQGDDPEALVDAHVFDYYQWKRSTEAAGRLRLAHAAGRETHLALSLSAARQTYRRFDHYSPTEIQADTGPAIAQRALVVGYDPEKGEASDAFTPPGRAFTSRAAVTARARLGALRGRFSAGALTFASGDSALADIRRPFGGDARLDPEDLAGTSPSLVPEAYLGLGGGAPRGFRWWGLLFQQALPPPLEALYGPRAYLRQVRPEGVMGNPALRPEREQGAEIGCALPLSVAGRRLRLALAGHAGRITDALTTTSADLDGATGLFSAAVPVYENGATLRRRGLHFEAEAGDPGGAFWTRLSYDLARIESDRCEPVLLDLRWLHPDRVQGEYDSEGYATPLGGILDEWVANGAAVQRSEYRPANADRTHALSLALVRPADLPFLGADWTLGALLAYESGRPFTQTLVHPAELAPGTSGAGRGPADPAWERPLAGFPRNGQRMPARFRIDAALQRRWLAARRALTLRVEVLNLLGIANAVAVHRATGQPDDDGCADLPGCALDAVPAAGRDLYAARAKVAEHYDIPWMLQIRLGVEFFR